jgi:hypothetical protein
MAAALIAVPGRARKFPNCCELRWPSAHHPAPRLQACIRSNHTEGSAATSLDQKGRPPPLRTTGVHLRVSKSKTSNRTPSVAAMCRPSGDQALRSTPSDAAKKLTFLVFQSIGNMASGGSESLGGDPPVDETT